MSFTQKRLLFALLTAFFAAGLAPTAAAAPASQESYTLNIYNEGGGKTVLMQDLIDLIHTLAPGTDVKWDLAGGIMLIETDSQKIQVLSRTPAVIIDGRYKGVTRPVLVRQEGVYIPLETVQVIFDAMGVNFDIKDDSQAAEAPAVPTAAPVAPAVPLAPPGVPPQAKIGETTPTVPLAVPQAPSPSPPAIPTPAVPSPAVIATATSTTATSITAQSPALTAAAPSVPRILPSFKDKALPAPTIPGVPSEDTPLQPPDALAARIGNGLSWGQLADPSHRKAPARLTIVHDGDLGGVAEALEAQLRQSLSLDVELVAINNSRRDSEGLVGRVGSSRPDLLIDLMDSPLPGKNGGGDTFSVWTVHEALWPKDREASRGAATDQTRYRRHEFQSMALGSLLRTELGRQFPDRAIAYELAPSYLLRRVDAPAAAVLIPGGVDAETSKRLLGAVSAAVTSYVRGMSRFSVAR